MNKVLSVDALATLALAGCTIDDSSRSATPRSQLIQPSVAMKGNGCNFEDSGANCKRPDATKTEIESDSGK
jgi:hypothetical protein